MIIPFEKNIILTLFPRKENHLKTFLEISEVFACVPAMSGGAAGTAGNRYPIIQLKYFEKRPILFQDGLRGCQ